MASYRKGVAYIALNDEPHCVDAEEMRGRCSKPVPPLPPKRSKHGFMLYPVYFRGKLIYVTIPE